jgi:DNA-binding response OmpR family regulator
MGGQELARRLAQARPLTKVLFMSGNPDQASLSGVGESPAKVLQKPFPLETLLQKVRNILDF